MKGVFYTKDTAGTVVVVSEEMRWGFQWSFPWLCRKSGNHTIPVFYETESLTVQEVDFIKDCRKHPGLLAAAVKAEIQVGDIVSDETGYIRLAIDNGLDILPVGKESILNYFANGATDEALGRCALEALKAGKAIKLGGELYNAAYMLEKILTDEQLEEVLTDCTYDRYAAPHYTKYPTEAIVEALKGLDGSSRKRFCKNRSKVMDKIFNSYTFGEFATNEKKTNYVFNIFKALRGEPTLQELAVQYVATNPNASVEDLSKGTKVAGFLKQNATPDMYLKWDTSDFADFKLLIKLYKSCNVTTNRSKLSLDGLATEFYGSSDQSGGFYNYLIKNGSLDAIFTACKRGLENISSQSSDADVIGLIMKGIEPFAELQYKKQAQEETMAKKEQGELMELSYAVSKQKSSTDQERSTLSLDELAEEYFKTHKDGFYDYLMQHGSKEAIQEAYTRGLKGGELVTGQVKEGVIMREAGELTKFYNAKFGLESLYKAYEMMAIIDITDMNAEGFFNFLKGNYKGSAGWHEALQLGQDQEKSLKEEEAVKQGIEKQYFANSRILDTIGASLGTAVSFAKAVDLSGIYALSSSVGGWFSSGPNKSVVDSSKAIPTYNISKVGVEVVVL